MVRILKNCLFDHYVLCYDCFFHLLKNAHVQVPSSWPVAPTYLPLEGSPAHSTFRTLKGRHSLGQEPPLMYSGAHP